MALTKQTITDKIETVKVLNTYYILQVRETIQVLEGDNILSQSYNRYVINPDHNVDEIEDSVVKAQFNAIMTDAVKQNYQEFISQY